MTFTTTTFKPSNLSRESTPWGREVEGRIQDLERAAARSDGNNLNANKSQNSSIDLVTKNISNITASVQAAISAITINPSQINPGTIPGGVLLNGSQVTTGTIPADVSASNVTAFNLFDQNVSFNITAGRVAVWGRTSDGLLATATSSERFKTDIEPTNWPLEKLEAVVNMASVYYHWISAIEQAKTDPNVQVHLEIGYIAERMHEAGLWEFVVYERGDDDRLLYNAETFEATGKREPIPYAIHYSNWAIAVHAVVQHLWRARTVDRADIDLLLKQAGLPSTDPSKE
jgi:hypothetical protein